MPISHSWISVDGLEIPPDRAPPARPRSKGKKKLNLESNAAPIFAAIKAGDLGQVWTLFVYPEVVPLCLMDCVACRCKQL